MGTESTCIQEGMICDGSDPAEGEVKAKIGASQQLHMGEVPVWMDMEEVSPGKSAVGGDMTCGASTYVQHGHVDDTDIHQRGGRKGVNIRRKGSYCLVQSCGKPLQYDTYGYRRHLTRTREHRDMPKKDVDELVKQFKWKFGMSRYM